jgi:methionyl-tRNA formyltransferase
MGCLNVHASLLPRWRGAAPIQQAILSGDEETGICLMQMDKGLDTGAVYACRSLTIGDTETAGELHDRLAALGAELLVSELAGILAGNTAAVPQDDDLATYAGKIRKDDARLDWSASAEELARRARAYNPVPGAWFELDGERIKVWRATAIPDASVPPGVVIEAGKQGIDVGCGDGALRLLEVQRPGRRKITADAFADQLPLVGKRLDG